MININIPLYDILLQGINQFYLNKNIYSNNKIIQADDFVVMIHLR